MSFLMQYHIFSRKKCNLEDLENQIRSGVPRVVWGLSFLDKTKLEVVFQGFVFRQIKIRGGV